MLNAASFRIFQSFPFYWLQLGYAYYIIIKLVKNISISSAADSSFPGNRWPYTWRVNATSS